MEVSMEILKGKDVVKFIMDNDLMENQIFIYQDKDSLGFMPKRIEADEDGDITIFGD